MPLEFTLKVQYLANLEGKIKFVDLGTHIFYKNKAIKANGPYKFSLHSVSDNLVSDDLSDYSLVVKDSL